MLVPSVDTKSLNAGLKILKEADENVIKNLRATLKLTVGPYAAKIAAEVPSEPALSGFGNNGDTGWSKARGTVNLTPGRSRKSGNHLLSIRVTAAKGKRGVYIAEMAGMRSGGFTPQGRSLIQSLNRRYPMIKRGGRFAFDKFRKTRPEFVKLAILSVKQVTNKINKDLIK